MLAEHGAGAASHLSDVVARRQLPSNAEYIKVVDAFVKAGHRPVFRRASEAPLSLESTDEIRRHRLPEVDGAVRRFGRIDALVNVVGGSVFRHVTDMRDEE